jgi:hypothetical protein
MQHLVTESFYEILTTGLCERHEREFEELLTIEQSHEHGPGPA